MILEGLHEKEIFTEQYPFRLEVNTTEDFQYPLHWHNAVELVFNAAGICRLTVAGVGFVLEEGDLLLIPSGEIHEINSCSRDGKRYFIQFNISALDGFGGISDIKPYTEKILRIGKEDPQLYPPVKQRVTELIEEYEKKEYAYALALNARVFDILVRLARGLAAREELQPGNPGLTKKIAGLSQINLVFEYIEKNYPSAITLRDASKAAGFSEYHFSRLFKEYTGQNFHSYLTSYRVKQAEKLLKYSHMQIAEIALETGFSSLVTFNRTFRKLKGCPPTLYRKAGR